MFKYIFTLYINCTSNLKRPQTTRTRNKLKARQTTGGEEHIIIYRRKLTVYTVLISRYRGRGRQTHANNIRFLYMLSECIQIYRKVSVYTKRNTRGSIGVVQLPFEF